MGILEKRVISKMRLKWPLTVKSSVMIRISKSMWNIDCV
jgi:hypothetical protein